jgi:hypothetical protein
MFHTMCCEQNFTKLSDYVTSVFIAPRNASPERDVKNRNVLCYISYQGRFLSAVAWPPPLSFSITGFSDFVHRLVFRREDNVSDTESCSIFRRKAGNLPLSSVPNKDLKFEENV